jgi:hypothetical protein
MSYQWRKRKARQREVHPGEQWKWNNDPKFPLPAVVDEIDRGLYNNRPARMRAESIGQAMKRVAASFEVRKVQDMFLPNLTHRIEFEQMGRIPEMEECLEYAPSDGRYVARAAWMDGEGIGHVYLAWKEKTMTIDNRKAESA